jgi:hypothetical protein
MQPARRTIEHSGEGGWSSVAVHLQAAGPGKDGFYLTLFPDARPPSVIFLRPPQLQQILDMAGQAAVTDQQIWDVVAKIPMEPLLPSRSLYPRLRALLVDAAAAIRAQIRAQQERPVPRSSPLLEDEAAPGDGAVSQPSPGPSWSGGSYGGGGPDDSGSGLG